MVAMNFWTAAVLGLSVLGLPVKGHSFDARSRNFRNIPAPELLAPVTDDLDLSGKTELEFVWQKTDPVNTDRYIFKLYKGYSSVGTQPFRRRDVYRGERLTIPAQDFEIGNAYTWTLQQVFFTGRKSDIASGSFTVLKK